MSLNDPQWGRSGGSAGDGKDDADSRNERDPRSQQNRPQRPGGNGQDGPPDLDELWRDFNKRLNNLFGKKGGGRGDGGGSSGGGMRPDAKGAGIGAIAVLLAAVLIWLASGFYIVDEGRVGVVTTFGKYSESTPPGLRWRYPWPIQAHEVVNVLSLQTVEIGARGRSAERLKEALMLTDDENIVDMHFTVQYRIKETAEGAKDFLFNSRGPTEAVQQSAESAMREVVGRKTMDSVLYESRQEIAEEVRKRMQEMLDRYGTGILIAAVAIQNAQPPEQVQAAFDDAVRATQDRERQINEGQAYANDIVPKARGLASRLVQEAEGYRSRVIETAQGDAARFRQILVEYNRAPAVTRDRMYLETMQTVFTNVSKVMVDTRGNSNLLYLPLDKLMQQAIADSNSAAAARAPVAGGAAEAAPATADRSRDASRSRDRESR